MAQQDKARIYNSRQWRELRVRKLTEQPLCEICREKGLVVSARCVHHKVPIETAKDYQAMWTLATTWDNLQSLCFQCHSDIHQKMNSRTKEGHKQATEAALERWIARHKE